MKTYSVVFSPEAEDQLVALYSYIALRASPMIAQGYVERIIEFCENLGSVPHQGVRRDDIRPGLRIVGFERRVNVAFAVEATRVSIIGVYYGGQDYETALKEEG